MYIWTGLFCLFEIFSANLSYFRSRVGFPVWACSATKKNINIKLFTHLMKHLLCRFRLYFISAFVFFICGDKNNTSYLYIYIYIFSRQILTWWGCVTLPHPQKLSTKLWQVKSNKTYYIRINMVCANQSLFWVNYWLSRAQTIRLQIHSANI